MKETAKPKEKTDSKNFEEESEEEKPDLTNIIKSYINLTELKKKYDLLYEKVTVKKAYNAYEEKLEHDTYLYSTLVLAFFSPWLLSPLFFPVYAYFGDRNMTLKHLFLSGIAALIIFPIFVIVMIPLMLPGFFTPLVQIFAINQILSSIDSSDMNTELFDLKCLLIVVVFFMLVKEACQGLYTLLYWLIMPLSILKTRYPLSLIYSFCSLAVIPGLIQITLCFYLAYLSIIIVMEAETAIELIQNFAGLYILMELDNIVFTFLQLSKLGVFVNLIYEQMTRMFSFGYEEYLDLEKKLKEVLGPEDIEVDFTKYKALFIIMKIVVVVGLFGFFVYESVVVFEGLGVL